jgi:nucleoside-diphosphate-sugar epimerase
MSEPRFLVTGAHGCVGAWVVHELLADGREVTTFDLSTEPRRLRLLIGDEANDVRHVPGDIADPGALALALDDSRATHVVHLAALQVPFVRDDPMLGGRVNVLGTVNVFEAAAARGVESLVYASSIAAFDAAGTMEEHPSTLYGVYKRANEGTAAVYFAERGLASVGLRPHTVYGVGRDQGLTSAPTTAMLAAAAGAPYTIPFGGTVQLQLARDAARAFVAASLAGATGATVHNLAGQAVPVTSIVEAIAAAAPGAEVSSEGEALPFPGAVDASSFRALVPSFADTPLAEGVQETIDRFRELVARGLVSPPVAA